MSRGTNSISGRIRKRRRNIILKKSLLCVAAVILIAAFSTILGSGLAEAKFTAEIKPQKYYKSIELSCGDTLWEIAEKYMDDSYDSIYDYIDELKEINGLTSDEIHSGCYLTVVYSASGFLKE